MRGGCRFYTTGGRETQKRALLARLRAEWLARVHFVEMRLEAFFRVFRQARELDSHPYAGVASANNGAGGEVIFLDPEIHPQRCADVKGHDGLYITPVAADVCCIDAERSADELIAPLQRKANLVAHEFSAIVLALCGALVGLHILRKHAHP